MINGSFSVNSSSDVLPAIINTENLTIHYSSGNRAVVTIDKDTGVVTFISPGIATIYATFSGDSTYKPKVVSYILKSNIEARGN
jgi:hypothetical protein